MSTTFEIGRCPAPRQPCLQPQRRGPDPDAVKPRAVKRGHSSGTSTVDRGESIRPPRRPSASASISQGGGGERRAGDRVHLAGDAVDAEAVRAVRVQVELHDLRRKSGRPRRAASRARAASANSMIPSESSPISSSVSERIIPFDSMPRSFALRELRPVGQPRARQRDGDGEPGRDVGRAADDRPLAVARVDHADPQPVGVRMLLGGDDVADDEALCGRRADVVNALDLDRLRREQRRDLLGVEAGIAVLAQARSTGTLIGTAPGSGRRSRRTGAGRGSRASASRSARSPSRRRSPGPSSGS